MSRIAAILAVTLAALAATGCHWHVGPPADRCAGKIAQSWPDDTPGLADTIAAQCPNRP